MTKRKNEDYTSVATSNEAFIKSKDEFVADSQEIPSDPNLIRKEKRIIMKNTLLICLAFLCNFTAFGGVSNLQSSLNYQDGLGTSCLAVIYTALIVSAMFLPTYIISKLGCKWTICLSIVGYTTYSIANFYPGWSTLIPSSIIVGLCAAPLWAAKCTYLTTSARRFAHLSQESEDASVNKFFGIFFLFFQFNNIVGNLISTFVLSNIGRDENQTKASSDLEFPSCFNDSFIESYCGSDTCPGADFKAMRKNYSSEECPTSALQSEPIPRNTLFLLMGIYTVIALLGSLIVALGVDPIKTRDDDTRSPLELLVATFKHMKDKRQILLIIITMYSGLEQGFLWGDYTQAYITCPLAVNWVGIALICFGSFDSVCSLLFGRIEKWTGRMPLFTMAALIHFILIVVLQSWIPYPDSPIWFFTIPALWGIADAVWQTQLNALYGVLFVTNQAACFANYRLWESLGFVLAFGYQSHLCVGIKLWILLCFLIVGMILYYYIEFTERKRASSSLSVSDASADFTESYLESKSSIKKDTIV